MSHNYRLFVIGLLLVGAFLELRHLVNAIITHFRKCTTLREVLLSLWRLDDVTITGVLVCGFLAVALILTIFDDIIQSEIRP